ncbi:MAG: hypothetical protein WA240_00415 [Nitrospirota bacterium]
MKEIEILFYNRQVYFTRKSLGIEKHNPFFLSALVRWQAETVGEVLQVYET